MKYRLIKEYPGSPELGAIVELKRNGGYELENSTSYFMTKDKVENYPEFWEKIVEKDYEILEYINTDNKEIYIFNKNMNHYEQKIQNNNYTFHSRQKYFVETFYKIHSVKRLSDGEIFTVGDRVSYSKNKEYDFNITSIILDPFKRISLFGNNGKFTVLTNKKAPPYKIKQSLFTTEDGVDIYEGDKIWCVSNELDDLHDLYTLYEGKAITSPKNSIDIAIYFSTKEAAEEYILMNKPCLSLKEIKENTTVKGLSLKKLQKLVQQKLNL